MKGPPGAGGRLATFPAHRILVFAHPDDEEASREEKLAEARERFGIPVLRGEVTR